MGSFLTSLFQLEVGNDANKGLIITRERHRYHLRKCVDHLSRFLDANLTMDLAAEEIRYV
jgi:tRNA U34 5-carboxymethylaminomethyl modifying GTPase MnmE/TrmE